MREEIPAPQVPRADPHDVIRQAAQGAEFVLVDVRSREAYEKAHIAGAISLPIAELSARYRELPADTALILY